jgi:SAM-dependent methyltransferase
VDKSRGALERLQHNFAAEHSNTAVHTLHADFSRRLSLPPLDGVIMANSLHFYRKKRPVLTHVTASLKPGGRLIVVEYNTRRGNYAVPHPLHESEFLDVAEAVGLCDASIISRIPSSFLGEMYAGLAFAADEHRNRPE